MPESKFHCPVCKSPISESTYNKIVRLEEEKLKLDEQQKKELAALKIERAKLAKEKEDLRKRYEKQVQAAVIKAKQDTKKENKADLINAKSQGMKLGMEKQMKRIEVTNKLYQQTLKNVALKDKHIKDLEEQIKKGTTPQIEGLELEKELVKELKAKFPQDEIIHYGQGGDILHKIIHDKKELGSILYECKRTKTFKKDYIKQIKQDMASRNATYGVLLTYAFDKKRAGFWVEEGILIIHPYGTIHLAELIRKWLIAMYSAKLSKEEMLVQAKKLWDYVKSEKFKNKIGDTIFRTKELQELLQKEVSAHQKTWQTRDEHYKMIKENTALIEKDSNLILKEEELLELPKELEIMPIRKKKKLELAQ